MIIKTNIAYMSMQDYDNGVTNRRVIWESSV